MRPRLPSVTLVAATSVNLPATVAALSRCIDAVEFGDHILFTDADLRDLPSAVRVQKILPLRSSREYSHFILNRLADYVHTTHVLVVQWDGFIVDPTSWDETFLHWDYIGAPWPQFSDGWDVGNGGFSLRSKRLLEACRHSDFKQVGPEDVAICRVNRAMLEERRGLRFPSAQLAATFAYERSRPAPRSFGFHGVFNMIDVVGIDRFWDIYCSLDERHTLSRSFGALLRQIGQGRGGVARQRRLIRDRLRGLLR